MASRGVASARDRICRQAEAMGYLVTRREANGVTTLCLLWLGPTNPHIRYIEVVPDGTPEDQWLRDRVVASGLAIPERVTPTTVQGLLDLLVELERSMS